MDLTLSDDQLRAIVVEALFSKLDQSAVKEMVTKALASLMQPQKDNYGRQTSPGQLQQAVETALVKLAQKVCEEEFAKEETRAKVSTLVQEAVEKTLVLERDSTVAAMTNAFRDSLFALRRDR